MAAPFVTGTIACLYEVAPKAKLSTIREALISTTRKVRVWGSEPELGVRSSAMAGSIRRRRSNGSKSNGAGLERCMKPTNA